MPITKVLIPAFKASVGDWEYYLCVMKYAEVDRQIKFAYEFETNPDLGKLIQRGISERTAEIRDYLLTNEHRFLGALVVAAFGGHPEYIPVEMVDQGSLLEGVDRDFGVLTFDGSHRFFALDGQHRLKAIKDALIQNALLGNDDIGVIVVPHFDTKEGKQRTRRLFTNINRNAVRTSMQENIALDEDDGFAILTRRMLDEHEFLSRLNVVQVFTRQGEGGEYRLAGRSVSKTAAYWTTIVILYDMLGELGWDLEGTMRNRKRRASDTVLDSSYAILCERIDELLMACGQMRDRYERAAHPREVRGLNKQEAAGHPFMRPIVQLAIVRALHHILEQGRATWSEALARLSELDWRMGEAPWNAVFNSEKRTMATGKDYSNLLQALLMVHLAPSNKAEITRALKEYRALKNVRRYPVTEEALAARIPASSP